MYAWYFVWQWSVLATALTALVLGVWLSAWWLLFLVLVVLLRLDACRVRVRTLTCCGARPTSRQALIQACRGDVCVVGQGWHFFLQRQAPRRVVVFTDGYAGTYTHRGVRYWKSGTTIGEMAKFYKTRAPTGKAFHSMPSYENISLGAWVVDVNHGSSGDRGKPSNAAFGMVDYLDHKNRARQTPYSALVLQSVKCVLGVHINTSKLNNNFSYEKRALFMTDALTLADMTAWTQPCFQRVLFIGKRTIGVVWTRTLDDPPAWQCCSTACTSAYHRDPHCCSRFCLWCQVDPCNVCCAGHEPKENYHSVVSNYELNRFVPFIWTAFTLLACLHLNVEIIVDLRRLPDALSTARVLLELHDQLRLVPSGRFELRLGTHFLFVDVSLRYALHKPFEALHSIGFRRYALHKGKYQFDYDAYAQRQGVGGKRMQRVSVQDMFGLPVSPVAY